MSETIAPGWYPDPVDRDVQRYWDGEQWIGDPIPADAAPPPTPPTAPPAVVPAVPQSAAPAPEAASQIPPGGLPGAPVPWMRFGDRVMVQGRHLAPLSARFMARLVDILVVAGLNLVVNGWFVYQWIVEMMPVWAATQRVLLNQTTELPPTSDRATRLLWAIIITSLALWFAYEVPALAWRGQTLGKRLFEIKVIRLDGELLGFWGSFSRWFVMAIPNLAFPCLVPLQVADVLWCTWDRPLRQCIHDKRAASVVVRLGPQDHPATPARRDEHTNVSS